MADITAHLQSEGRELVGKGSGGMVPDVGGAMRFEIHDLRVTMDQRVAHYTDLQRIG